MKQLKASAYWEKWEINKCVSSGTEGCQFFFFEKLMCCCVGIHYIYMFQYRFQTVTSDTDGARWAELSWFIIPKALSKWYTYMYLAYSMYVGCSSVGRGRPRDSPLLLPPSWGPLPSNSPHTHCQFTWYVVMCFVPLCWKTAVSMSRDEDLIAGTCVLWVYNNLIKEEKCSDSWKAIEKLDIQCRRILNSTWF